MSEVMHLDDPLLALDDEEMAEHVSNCDECAAKLAADARLELALGELHAFRSGSRHIAKPSVIRVYFTPIVIVLAAAAALFFVLRSRHSGPALVQSHSHSHGPENRYFPRDKRVSRIADAEGHGDSSVPYR